MFLVWLKDTAERAVSAFVLAFIALVPLNAITDLSTDTAKKAAVAGLLSALVVVKSALAALFGNRSSASLIPDLPAEQVAVDPKK
jgi:hypothetical protein